MINDRQHQFRQLYKAMGMGDGSYLVSQLLSFLIMQVGVFQLLILLFSYYGQEEATDNAIYYSYLSKVTFLYSIISILFHMALSQLFTSAKLGRDCLFLFNIFQLLFSMMRMMSNKPKFILQFHPTNLLLEFYMEFMMGSIIPEDYSFDLTFFFKQLFTWAFLLFFSDFLKYWKAP